MDVMSDGCLCLAQLWDSAWKDGGGDAKVAHLGAVDEGALETLYRSTAFLTSYTLDTIGAVLTGGSGATAQRGKAKGAARGKVTKKARKSQGGTRTGGGRKKKK